MLPPASLSSEHRTISWGTIYLARPPRVSLALSGTCKEDLLPNLSWRESSIQESCLAEWDHFLFSVLVAGWRWLAGWLVAGPSLSVTFQSDVNVTNTERQGEGGYINRNISGLYLTKCVIWYGGEASNHWVNIHHEILQIASQNIQSWAPRPTYTC